MPDASEVEEHRKNHLPYRNWCTECVMGRGVVERRGAHTGRKHMIPRVGIDYFYITGGGIKRRRELDFDNTSEGEEQLNAAPATWLFLQAEQQWDEC